jgi:L-amino acid N-acyltransferase YncA
MMLNLREMTPHDWPAVAQIYQEGIDTGNATFQTEVPDWLDWHAAHLPTCRVVAVIGTDIAGWAALTPVSSRCVYAGVAEVSVYVSNRFRGQKVGTQLLTQLIVESEKIGIWTLQSGVFPENQASLQLHEALGFRVIGHRENVGKMFGKWRNTILLERRSRVVGIDA